VWGTTAAATRLKAPCSRIYGCGPSIWDTFSRTGEYCQQWNGRRGVESLSQHETRRRSHETFERQRHYRFSISVGRILPQCCRCRR
jgi:hypothetical protein